MKSLAKLPLAFKHLELKIEMEIELVIIYQIRKGRRGVHYITVMESKSYKVFNVLTKTNKM